MKRNITIIFCFGLMLNIGYSQNKKEQLEALSFSVDSLNKVVQSEKKLSQEKSFEIEGLKKQIDDLSKNIKVNQSNLVDANNEINKLKLELESVKICNQFMNYSSLTSLGELNKIQSCAPPSIIKSEFYRYYYEVCLLIQMRKDFNLVDINDVVLLDLLKVRRNDILSQQFDQKEESEIVSSIIALDRLFKSDGYNNQKTVLSETFAEMLENFYFNQLSNEYNIQVYDNFILTFYNINGAGTEANVTQLYEIKNNTIYPINVYNDILIMLETKMVKHLGKHCTISRDFNITKVNGNYEVYCSIGKADDAFCCGSGEIKFLTSDFVSYNLNSLMWGIKNSDGDVISWKKY